MNIVEMIKDTRQWRKRLRGDVSQGDEITLNLKDGSKVTGFLIIDKCPAHVFVLRIGDEEIRFALSNVSSYEVRHEF